MSYTEMYVVPKEGPVECVSEFQNAHGGAWFVWEALYDAYEFREGEYTHQDGVLERVWDHFKSSDRARFFERVVLGSTFDNVMVKREHWLFLASCMEEFRVKHPRTDKVCSLLDQAAMLKQLYREAPAEIVAVCWNQTSVNGDAWTVYEPTDDDEEEDTRCYDITRDRGHWFLFDKLKIPSGPADPTLQKYKESRYTSND